MKLLSLKYKMHKLVNLAFYLIIFGIGFLLGFGADKINFNKLLSQFLFIDNVNAQELDVDYDEPQVCRTSYNLITLPNTTEKYNNLIATSLDNVITITGDITGEPSFNFYLNTILKPGTYTISAYQVYGYPYITLYDNNNSQIVNVQFNDRGSKTFVITQETTISRMRLYINGNSFARELKVMLNEGETAKLFEKPNIQICIDNNSFYMVSKKIFGEVSTENEFVYDFITFGLVVICFTLFVLVVGYIFKKFFGG